MHDIDHGRAEAEAESEQFEQWEAASPRPWCMRSGIKARYCWG